MFHFAKLRIICDISNKYLKGIDAEDVAAADFATIASESVLRLRDPRSLAGFQRSRN